MWCTPFFSHRSVEDDAWGAGSGGDIEEGMAARKSPAGSSAGGGREEGVEGEKNAAFAFECGGRRGSSPPFPTSSSSVTVCVAAEDGVPRRVGGEAGRVVVERRPTPPTAPDEREEDTKEVPSVAGWEAGKKPEEEAEEAASDEATMEASESESVNMDKEE